MANVQHSTLTDPQLHEPKGVSTAAAGDVYVADGAGSGNWEQRFENNPTYAEIDRPSAVMSLTGTTEVKVGSFAYDDVTGSKFSLTAGDKLTILESGLYSVHMDLVLFPATAMGGVNEVVEARVKINGGAPPDSRNIPVVVMRNAATTDPFSINLHRVIDLAANDYIELYLYNNASTRSYTVAASISLFKFGNL